MSLKNIMKEDEQICIIETTPADMQASLFVSVLKNKTKEIENIIYSDEKILEEKYVECGNENIFILACDDKYGMRDVKKNTIKTLIELMNEKFKEPSPNSHWEPLHYTAFNSNKEKMEAIIEALSPDERNSLVCCSKGSVENSSGPGEKKYSYSNNALHVLLKYGDRNTCKEFKECFKILLEHGVRYDQQDSDGNTPLDLINQDKDKDLKMIFQEVFPMIATETKNSDSKISINNEKEANGFDASEEKFSSCTLLQLFSAKGSIYGVKHLLKLGAACNKTIAKNPEIPLIIAMREDHECIVKLLLSKHIPEDILLKLQRVDAEDTIINKYMKIVLKHLQNHQNLDNFLSKTDDNGRTPLHYATKKKNKDNMEALLQFGASLLAKDRNEKIPLDYIDPDILKSHFDGCIKNLGKDADNKCYKMELDYKTLIPSEESKGKESLFLDSIIKRQELRPLICHPLVITFLTLKWQKFRWLIYYNLILYVMSYIGLLTYGGIINGTGAYTDGSNDKSYSAILLVPFLLLFIRTTIEFLLFKLEYFKHLYNFMDLFCILSICYIFLADRIPHLYNRNLLVAYSIILLTSTMGIFMHMRYFSFFSTKVIMLERISVNFFKHMSFYIFPILAFVVCFFMLKDEKQNEFFKMMFKTVNMFGGETDPTFPEEEFTTNPIFGHFIYLLFLVIIGIILQNLLLGLATCDMQDIRLEVDFIDKLERSKYIFQYENIIYNICIKLFLNYFPVLKKNTLVVGLQDDNKLYVKNDKNSDLSDDWLIRDQETVGVLLEVWKNLSFKKEDVKNRYTVKNLYERIGKIEDLVKKCITLRKRVN